jgi:hypothetical protein
LAFSRRALVLAEEAAVDPVIEAEGEAAVPPEPAARDPLDPAVRQKDDADLKG